MPAPDPTMPACTDPDNVLDYKLGRLLAEMAGVANQVNIAVTDDRKLLKYKAILALRSYLLYLDGLDIADFLPREVVGKYRFQIDGTFQLFNDDELGYRALFLRGVGNEVHFELGPLDTDL